MLVTKTQATAAAIFLLAGSVCSGQATQGDTADATPDAKVTVTDYDTVSLNVQNTDLAQVLQLLSIQGQRNIVTSPQVAGTVTANLYDVTFHEALDAILQQNGMGYRERGNFIYVYTLEQLRKIEEAERKLSHKVFKLNYITADDASTFVTPLLSSAGSIAISGAAAPGFQPTMADGGANSNAHGDTMVLRDYPENVEEIAKVIEALDIRPKQVLIEATIMKADVTEDMEFGVDFSILADIGLEAFTNPLSAVNQLIDGSVTPESTAGAVTTAVGNVSGDGGIKIGVTSNNVSAFVRALDSVTDTTVLANPKLLVLNRQKADVLVGEKIGYLSTTATATATTQTVEFLDTGTQLTVRPFVSEDGYIRMELKPQVSTARIRDVVPGTSNAAVTIPDEITQELTTNIIVRDGQTIVLGGLFKEETSITRDQVPFLGDIPIAGAAFQGRDDNLTRFEVVFLVTPHIIRESALYAAGKATQDSAEMVRIGAREGLLPWSRSKLSASHIRKALESIEQGDRDAALWQIDAALGLDPTAVEALRLKEKLTGQRVYWPQRSMLDEAVDQMVEDKTGKRGVERPRPMMPDPRKSRPSSDGEPLFDAQPTPAEAATEAVFLKDAIEPIKRSESITVSPTQVEPIETETTETETVEAEATETANEAAAEVDVEPAEDSIEISEFPATEADDNIVTATGESTFVTEGGQAGVTDDADVDSGAAGEPMTEQAATEPADADGAAGEPMITEAAEEATEQTDAEAAQGLDETVAEVEAEASAEADAEVEAPAQAEARAEAAESSPETEPVADAQAESAEQPSGQHFLMKVIQSYYDREAQASDQGDGAPEDATTSVDPAAEADPVK